MTPRCLATRRRDFSCVRNDSFSCVVIESDASLCQAVGYEERPLMSVVGANATRHFFHDVEVGGNSLRLAKADQKSYDFGMIRSLLSGSQISFWERCSPWFDSSASGRTINAHVS
jgi:hypothetical protein